MHLEKLCADTAECVLISDQATNPEKQHRLQGSSSTREKFTRRFDADSPARTRPRSPAPAGNPSWMRRGF
jgi:hypothetical protein